LKNNRLVGGLYSSAAVPLADDNFKLSGEQSMKATSLAFSLVLSLCLLAAGHAAVCAAEAGPTLTTTAASDAEFLDALRQLNEAFLADIKTVLATFQPRYEQIASDQDLATQDTMIVGGKIAKGHWLFRDVAAEEQLQIALRVVAFERLRAACRTEASTKRWRQSYEALREKPQIPPLGVWSFLRLKHEIEFTLKTDEKGWGYASDDRMGVTLQTTGHDAKEPTASVRFSRNPDRNLSWKIGKVTTFPSRGQGVQLRTPVLEGPYLLALTETDVVREEYIEGKSYRTALGSGGAIGEVEDRLGAMELPFADVYFTMVDQGGPGKKGEYYFANVLRNLLLAEDCSVIERSYREKSGISLEGHAAWEQRIVDGVNAKAQKEQEKRDRQPGSVVIEFDRQKEEVTGVAIGPKGDRLFLASGKSLISFSLPAGQITSANQDFTARVIGVHSNSSRGHVVAVAENGEITIHDGQTLAVTKKAALRAALSDRFGVEFTDPKIERHAVSGDGRLLACVFNYGQIMLVDLDRLTPVWKKMGEGLSQVAVFNFDKAGTRLIGAGGTPGGGGGFCCIFDTKDGAKIAERTFPFYVSGARFDTATDGVLVSTNREFLRGGQDLDKFSTMQEGHLPWITSEDGKYYLAKMEPLLPFSGGDSDLRVFEAASARQICRLNTDGSVGSATFSPDGRLVVVGHSNGICRAYRVGEGD